MILKQPRRFLLSMGLLGVSLLLFCSLSVPTKSENPGPSYSGMKRIASANKSFIQGASDSLASGDEKPVTPVSFTYDYWLGQSEVTQKEYFDIMQKSPVSDTSAYGKGDWFPVYNVSWFDAVLFCNAKSKKERLDTVYSYYGQPKQQNGSVYELAGVQIHYDRGGYRLPTESEWEFAAREGGSALPFPHLEDSAKASGYAWYSSNSFDKSHPVSQCASNAFGLFDMAGNVFEWTGDWKNSYNGKSIVNSIGAELPNANIERVIKGGSFKTGFLSMRPSRRGATYPTSQNSFAEYIGFRLAWGIIPNPSAISNDTFHLSTNPVFLTVASLKPFLGTANARVVFVNVSKSLRTLCYVDFGKGYPAVQEAKDIQSVFAPTISPNGKFVAFCTKNDLGATGKSTVYVRTLDSLLAPATRLVSDSAFVPRWWVDPTSLDTFLVYTNSAIDNTSALWSTTKTMMVKMSGPQPAAPAVELIGSAGYHDGRSRSGRYMVTGYRQLLMRDEQTQKEVQLFTFPQNGKIATASTQVCNASVSPDPIHDDRCIFEDFGSPLGSTLVGRPYGVHEYIFMADFSGKVNSWYRSPDQESSWDFPEWSNRGQFAIACGTNSADEPHALYAIDLLCSTHEKIAEGSILEYPYLWVHDGALPDSDAGSLDLDSLGYYNDPPLAYNVAHFTKRMLEFWRNHSAMEIVFAGSSHTADGVDPKKFTMNTVYNMAFSGCPMGMTLSIINNYVLNNCPAVKLIGFDIIPGLMNSTDYYKDWIMLPQNKGYTYDKNHLFWKAGTPPNFDKFMSFVSVPVLPTIDTLGLDSLACLNWGGQNPDVPGSQTWTTSDASYTENFNTIKELARTLAKRNIHLLLYTTPESPYYASTDSYGLYGPSRETGRAIVSQLQALQDSVAGYFHFYDANLEGAHDYGDGEAADFDHLCSMGAQKFSMRLDSVVQRILKP